jgi:hypothetical protein
VGQVYLDARSRRLYYLNDTARQLHDQGVPFTAAELHRQPLQTLQGGPVAVTDLPLFIAWRRGYPAEATFVWTSAGTPAGRVAWSAAPLIDADGRVTGVMGSVWCPLPEPDWQALAGLAHDLATPLNAIGLCLATLDQQPAADPAQRELYEGLRVAVDRAVRVGRDLLEWSRHQARRGPEAQPTWIALEPFLTALVREQTEAARRKGLTLSADLAAAQDWEVNADLGRLGRLLANLLVNAVRYTPVGRVSLAAEWRDGAPGRQLALSVIDTGAGISDEEQDSIFQPFERGRAGKEDDSGGSGLGLAVVDRLVEELGLALEVYSEYGRGSAFHLLVPGRLLRPRSEG